MREEIIRLLDQHRLKEALSHMAQYAARTSDWQLKNEIENLQTSYGLMLQYASKGMKDPNKVAIYHRMLRTAYELADCTYIAVQATESHGIYYDTLRTFAQVPPHSYPELQLQLEAYTEDMATAPLIYAAGSQRDKETDAIRQRHEAAVDELFEKIWVSPRWSEPESAEAQALFRSPLIQANDLAVMVSAATISLLQIFDIRKFMFLLEAYAHQETMVNQRALVGIALACYYCEKHILRYPEAVARMDALNEEADFAKQLHHVQIQLLQSSRETRKIDKKMREEILPEMIKNSKLNLEGLDEDANERNPEWEEWMDRSGINEKLQELGELQMSGADVYMSTFSQLKQFPFFRKTAHWFYPFDPQYKNLAKLLPGNDGQPISVLSLLVNSNMFCNSDKYSFCFTMLQMPEAQRKLMQQQLNGQIEMSEELKERLKGITQSKGNAEFMSRQYIHDLYRFFKIWPRRHEMHDLFEDTLDLWNKKTLSSLLHREYINQLADYLFTHDALAEAGALYDKSIELYHQDQAELWQKAGFIHQKTGDYGKAISYYLKSDLQSPDNVWNNRHLAQCYRKEGDYAKALEYYLKVEQVQPDSLNLALQIGQCLIALERYDEALAYFFKVEYLDKKPQNARRAIAWCSFITGNHLQAKKYYDLLTADPHPITEDWMNAGHVYYILGDMEKAIGYYRKAKEQCGNTDEFVRLYRLDQKELMKQGADEVDLSILPDELS